ncbi:GDSL esterase/lipase 7 [Nymphaea thermarum]|nr:GDSL esterase/lipase 7 [Nymphaea thermarum]
MLKGISFASAAAGILEETGANYVARITFDQQLTLFEKTIALEYSPFFQNPQALSVYLAKSIYIVVFGSNDYINNYLMPKLYASSRLYDPHTYGQILVQVITRQLQRLYSLGARKIVVVNVGPLGCMPSQLAKADTNGQCVGRVNQAISAFNSQLVELVKNINSTLPGSTFVHYNVYDTFMNIVDNPAMYGFTVSNRACCGVGMYGGALTCLPLEKPCEDRDQHVFWDAFHPTQAVHKIIAQSCYSGQQSACQPVGFLELARL